MRKILFLMMIVATFIACEPDDNNTNSNDPRDKISGTWNAEESSNTYGNQHYDVGINPDLFDSTMVVVSNFFGLGYNVEAYATMNGTSLSFPQQTLSGGFKIAGTATISGDYKTISLQYTVEEVPVKSGSVENVTAVYTKQ